MAMLHSLSKYIVRLETFFGAILGISITLLILLNVVTRSMGNALFWVDEAAISAMVWMSFLGASISLHHKQAVSVTIISDSMPKSISRVLGKLVDFCVLAFCAILLMLTWRWFDPLTLASNGFDTRAFAGATFNFIYAETTTTLGIPKFWLWIIMPIFSFNATVHALSNLLGARPAEKSDAKAATV